MIFWLVMLPLGIACVACIVLPLVGRSGSLGRVLDLFSHFELQYLLAAIAATIGFALMQRWGWMGVGLAGVVLNTLFVAPWYFGRSGEATDAPRVLRLMLVNVWVNNAHHDRVIDLIRDERPDVVILQEINRRWLASLSTIEDDYPFQARSPNARHYGDVIYSRVPMVEQYLTTTSYGNPSVMSVELDVGEPITLVSMHPPPPMSQRLHSMYRQMYDAAVRHLQNADGPRLFAGDMNCSMWGASYRRLVRETDMHDARQGFGVLPSWPTHSPLMRTAIDHVLHDAQFQVLNCRLGPNVGSDHRPVIVDFALSPARH